MDKQYCCLVIEKSKDFENMNNRFKHNHRQKGVANADPALSYKNKILINKKEQSYQDLYKKAINQRYKVKKRIRKDAVKLLEIVASFSHDAEQHINLRDWIRDNVNFISNHFGGRENILDAVLHMDESTPHLHFIIIPITKDGRLCANEFISNKKSLIKLQDDYAKAMAPHGLSRGERGSFLKHNDIRKFYAKLGEVIGSELPKPFNHENTEAYYSRANKAYKKKLLAILQEKEALKKKMIIEFSQKVTRYKALDPLIHLVEKRFGSVNKAKEALEENYYLNKGLESVQELYPDQYINYKGMLDKLIKGGQITEKGEKKLIMEEKEKEKEGI